MPSIQAATSSFAVQVSAAPVHGKDEIEGVIAAQARDPGGGFIVMPDVFNDVNRELIIALAARYSVPTIYFNRFFSEPGGLISYGDVRSEQFRLAAGYIDRVLKGEKPADLPVQVPTKFELIINLKTAKALGLTIPDKLLATADEVIECAHSSPTGCGGSACSCPQPQTMRYFRPRPRFWTILHSLYARARAGLTA
jgi:putative ABC transport system substrate-binding protein